MRKLDEFLQASKKQLADDRADFEARKQRMAELDKQSTKLNERLDSLMKR